MAYLSDYNETIRITRKYNIHAAKKFGQNFLTDAGVLQDIVDAAEIGKSDHVLEVGPGIGTLTQVLAENAGSVTAVEIDKNLLPVLSETLSEYDNVTVVNADILEFDIAKFCKEENGGKPIKLAANLPYYITTPIIMGILESKAPVSSITVMVQKEVGLRMGAAPGGKDYGPLSLAVQYYANPEIVCVVGPESFMPRPEVDSVVVNLKRYEKPPVEVKDEGHMFKIIKAAFAQRRKTLSNCLKNDAALHIEREKTELALEKMGLAPTVRGETLSLAEFAKLSDLLSENA